MSNAELPPHTVRAFDQDIARIRSLILECGVLASRQLNDAVGAMIRRDATTANEIELLDGQVDALQAAVEVEALNTISRRSPQADDLRNFVSAIKVVGSLERVGDYAKNIAKRTIAISEIIPSDLEAEIPLIARQVTAMVDDAVKAYIERDAELASDIIQRDALVDKSYNKLFGTILRYMDESGDRNAYGAHLLFVTKNLERVGDHATNIAELAYYNVTGSPMGHRSNAGTAYKPVARKVG